MDYSEIILVAASINEWREWEFITKATESRAAIVTISAQETVCGQTVSSVSLIASSTLKPRMELLLGTANFSDSNVVLLSSNNDASQPCGRNHISRYLNYMFIDLRLKLNLAPVVQNLHISLSFFCSNSGPCKTIENSLDVIPISKPGVEGTLKFGHKPAGSKTWCTRHER